MWIAKYVKSDLFVKENILKENNLKIENIQNFQLNARLFNNCKIKRKYKINESYYTSKSNDFYGRSYYNLQILCLNPETNLILKLRANSNILINFTLIFFMVFGFNTSTKDL